MGLVVEALAMTRASSMDVESVRKIVVVRPTFYLFLFSSFITIDLIILSIGHATIVKGGAYQGTAQTNSLGDPHLWGKDRLLWFCSFQRQGWDIFGHLEFSSCA